ARRLTRACIPPRHAASHRPRAIMTRRSISDDLLRDLTFTQKKWNIPRTKASFPSSAQPNPLRGYNMRYVIASIEGFGLQAPGNSSNRPPPSLDQLENQTDFVFMNGAAYMRLGGSLFPISGGRASGCFSVDYRNESIE